MTFLSLLSCFALVFLSSTGETTTRSSRSSASSSSSHTSRGGFFVEGKETLSASEEDFGAIIISEIMYDPVGKSLESSSISDGGDGDDATTRTGQKAARSGEWCEFLNPSSTNEVDMSSWYFTDKKNLNSENMFQFPLNTTVKPKERIVVAKNATKFELAHRGEPNEEKVVVVKDAELPFKLSNKGEKLILLNAEKELVHEVEYNDKAPWPIIFPGYSIELTSAKSDANDPFSWVSSLVLGGTPGRENSVELVNALNN